ncbi:NAD(P)-dependent oxidoreductase [Roseibium sp.]|uniref:NAD(P)-dependent oxidoreductase n=1 Tax=Roseibium sp. TaxID=1936156 RepID=UPI003D136CCA
MPPSKIVVAQPVENDVINDLSVFGSVFMNDGPAPLTMDDLRRHSSNAVALMAFMTECVDEDFLKACPDLQIVAGALKGFDNIDVDACTRRNIAVTIVPDLLTEPTAELAIGLMIGVSRHMISADQYVRSGQFSGWRPRFYGGSIHGATVGIVGAGRVGQAVLKLLSGFRCERIYFDQTPLPADKEQALGATYSPLDELKARSDFVVLALPLTDATMGLVDESFISDMKQGSYLINPARGSLVVESAVAKALETGHIAGFAADVFETEDWARTCRPDEVHPSLMHSDRTMLTPHIGSAVTDVRRAIVRSAADSIKSVLKGNVPATAINAQDLSV